MLIHEISWSKRAQLVLVAGVLLHAGFIIWTVSISRSPVAIWPVLVAVYALMFLLFRLFFTMRVSVEGTDLTVGFNLFRKRIPLRDIDQVAPVRYRFREFGGWGIRMRRGAVLYNVPGDRNRAVELTLRNGKRVLFSASDPDGVCLAIREQRALAPS